MSDKLITKLEVRDYECDLQGIVNNAVYLHYLEHARHKFLIEKDIDFENLTRTNVFLVVIRVEMDYLKPLRSKDKFQIVTSVEKISRLRFCFKQEIWNLSHEANHLRANVYGAITDVNGYPRVSRTAVNEVTDLLFS